MECCPTLQWLCKVAGYGRDLEHAVVHINPEHPKHANCVTFLVRMQAMKELGHFQLPRIVYRSLQHGALIIMLKREVMAAEVWHDNGPRDLVAVSLCIQIAIDKMQLGFLSVAYARPYHNPTATMRNSVHNVDISKPLAHTTPY